MRIDLLVLDGVFDTGLAALQDTFSLAQDLARARAVPTREEFIVRRIGVAGPVTSAGGLIVPTEPANAADPPDLIIVPAVGAKTPDAIARVLARDDAKEASAVLHAYRHAGATLAAARTGTFVLAESGLLDGLPATTSWWLTNAFRLRYPRVRMAENCTLLDAGSVITAGAALSHFDLALALVRRQRRALASETARYLSIENLRSTQAAFAMPDQVSHHDSIVERFESWAQDNLAAGFSLATAAKAVGTSPRTLARKLRGTLGKTPLEAFQEMRVERALQLLQMTHASVEEIAAEVGYADGVSLRLLLRRKLGRSIAELRKAEAAATG
ncbi:GlxA family transcriptional regulator [Hyphomicrobium sp.]|uniref:GlxA family transcriptional regulator n=1 Tax=Hyphomicrobium sp. TaxID=82 RepID=UPI002FE1C773